MIVDIQILRGIAILLVLVEHITAYYWQFPWMTELRSKYFAFWGGVDLFFAVSGFVIVRSVLRSGTGDGLSDRARTLISFWIRRAWRLWPAAWLCMAVFFLAAVVFVPDMRHGYELQKMSAAVLGGIFNIVNFQAWQDVSGVGRPNWFWGHYWSLSLEEQFYLFCVPLVLFLPRKWALRTMLALVLIQFPLQRAVTKDLWFVRSDAFSWGVLIAFFWDSDLPKQLFEPTLLRLRRYSLPFLGLSLAGLAATQLLNTLPFHIGLMAAISGALVFAASFGKGYLGIGGMPGRVLTWLGDRSYSLYLVHYPVIMFLQVIAPFKAFSRQDLPEVLVLTAVALAGGFVLAELSYRWVETPTRLHGRGLARSYQNPAHAPSRPVDLIV